MTEQYDAVIVGAGWFGLAAARAYKQLHSSQKMAIFESAESCGGTWSKNRLYPGLKSNNMKGTYEYPDFPMSKETYGVDTNQHIPGAVLHRYLTDFAHNFEFYDKIQFDTRVDVVRPDGDNGWTLSVDHASEKRTVNAGKLIIATGLTSTPNMPTYRGQETFGGPIFHAKDFCKEAPNVQDVKHTTVVGGAKSAFDVAYAMVEAGSIVDLVIRDNGHGPVWISHPFVTPFRKRLDQLLLLRWMTWFSPCPWGAEDGYAGMRRFLHGTWLGRCVVNFFWKVLSADIVAANGYDEHEELKKLKPWNSAFWTGSGLSIFNYQTNFFDMIKSGKVKVHIGNIDHLEPKAVILADGTRLAADAMICSTGWKKESTIKFEGLGPEGFGITDLEAEKLQLGQKADKDVLAMFPGLQKQPQLRFTPKTAEPLRLYRFMVPPTYAFKRNLAFAGAISSVSTSLCATVQGQWIAVFLANDLERMPQSSEDITKEVMLHTQWGKWRFPCGYGASLPDMVFEGLPYMDMLLHDMGLKNHRKKGWLAEMTSCYSPGDYVGLLAEWEEKHNASVKP